MNWSPIDTCKTFAEDLQPDCKILYTGERTSLPSETFPWLNPPQRENAKSSRVELWREGSGERGEERRGDERG